MDFKPYRKNKFEDKLSFFLLDWIICATRETFYNWKKEKETKNTPIETKSWVLCVIEFWLKPIKIWIKRINKEEGRKRRRWGKVERAGMGKFLTKMVFADDSLPRFFPQPQFLLLWCFRVPLGQIRLSFWQIVKKQGLQAFQSMMLRLTLTFKD